MLKTGELLYLVLFYVKPARHEAGRMSREAPDPENRKLPKEYGSWRVYATLNLTVLVREPNANTVVPRLAVANFAQTGIHKLHKIGNSLSTTEGDGRHVTHPCVRAVLYSWCC